jgi:hypothetical protein
MMAFVLLASRGARGGAGCMRTDASVLVSHQALRREDGEDAPFVMSRTD